MAKGWKNVGNINGLFSNDEVDKYRHSRKVNTLIRTTPSRDEDAMKKYINDVYNASIAEEDHILDVVENKRTTNPDLIKRAEKIKKARAEAAKKKKAESKKAEEKTA